MAEVARQFVMAGFKEPTKMLVAAKFNCASVAIAAISAATAETAGAGWKSVDVAERPSDDALLALAERLCNKPGT